jgi:hypothetical protein
MSGDWQSSLVEKLRSRDGDSGVNYGTLGDVTSGYAHQMVRGILGHVETVPTTMAGQDGASQMYL